MSIDGGGTRGRWTLGPDAFERLLAALNADRERAAIEYEQLRHRIIGLLRWWGASHPQELADETLDRVAHKLEGGAAIGQAGLGAYVRGVARMVYYESTRQPVMPALTRDVAATESSDDLERASACLDGCLGLLAAADRTTLLRYYDAGKAADVRKGLADELGITLTALRIRTHRLRTQVEKCVAACIDEQTQ
jgi:DNA-directed RNA polymerase specialized sigma24 family protein